MICEWSKYHTGDKRQTYPDTIVYASIVYNLKAKTTDKKNGEN